MFMAGVGISKGYIFQISLAYSAIVLSEENLPDKKAFNMVLLFHSFLFLYTSSTLF